MEDIKSLYLAAKSSGNTKDIAAYREAVQELLESNPNGYMSNLEYIISSSIGVNTWGSFVEKYGLSVACYDDVVDIFESCLEKAEAAKQDTSIYEKSLKDLEEFREKYSNCFMMYGHVNILNEKLYGKESAYIESYYSFNNDWVQNKKLLSGMIQGFGEMAVPDILITADQIGEKAVAQALSYVKECDDIHSSLFFQHMVESVKDLSSVSNDNEAVIQFNEYTNEMTLDSIVSNMKTRNTRIVQESALMGTADDAEIYYTEEEVIALNDLITFKEDKMTFTNDQSEAVKLYNEICSLYEEFDGLVDEVDTQYSWLATESPAMVNTRNKKTGEVPSYISRNHDLNDDFLDDKNKHNNDDPDPNSFIRPSAKKDDEEVNDTEEEQEDETEVKKDDPKSPVNNYYYYTYNNSLNKNSNSFNKDNSTHDRHDRHDVHDDHSTHSDSRRVSTDNSTNKRTNSNDYNHPMGESFPWELDVLSDTVFTESSDESSDVVEYEFYESSNYYMDEDTYDKHIKEVWFIKSDDNVQNCCVSVMGYAKPMRGRSSMIALKKKDGEWYALIKRKPDGQWEFPGGGWDEGEKPMDAAIRELHEEAQVNVKNVKRLGTQIQYNSSKIAVSPWVKKHVENSDDWWYGYYSSIFIGEEDGKFTGHIEEEDYEDTFTWKPLSFIAKKLSHKLMDSIEKHIQKEFNESTEYFSEAVDVKNKKFNKAYKAAFNYENGHLIKITYSLQGCEVTNVGLSKAMIDHVGSVAADVNKENHRGNKRTKNIRAFMVMIKGILGANKFVKNRKKMITDFLNDHIGEIGYLDFQAKNCKIIGLYDLYTMEEVKGTIPIVGVYSARHMDSGKSKILSDKDLAAVHKMMETKKTKFHVADHKVGDVEIYPTFMSTYWNDKGDHNIVDLSNKVIDSDERDRSEDAQLNNIPDLIGDLEAKGFHVSDEEVEAFLAKYRSKDKWIPDTLSNQVKNARKEARIKEKEEAEAKSKSKRKGKKSLMTEAVGDADDMKPESDHPIKDTLMDIDRELTKGQQKAKKKVQDIQNVGRALTKPVVRTKQWIGNMVQNWKDMDETKIKEKMADPHARNNLFTAIGSAIKVGSLAKAGILLNPIFLFLTITRNIGKDKREYRIRNEMIGELKAELEVIDEKIEDARRNNDTKAKYKLMRLRNEINKKLLRVGGSKGWKKII